MPRKRKPATIREQLEPHIRALGIRETSRRSGVAVSHLSAWLTRTVPTVSTRPRRLSDAQIEAVCAAVDMLISIRGNGL